MNIRDRLVADIARWHKMASIRLSAIGAFLFSSLALLPAELPHLWAMIPADIKAFLPAGVKAWLPLVMVICIAIARLTKKKDKPDA